MTWREITRRRLAHLIDRLALCRGGCRQHPSRCACARLPRLPDEPFDPPTEEHP